MQSLRFKQAGFEAIAVIAVVLVLTVIGFASYKVVTMPKTASDTSSTVQQADAPDTIDSKADLTSTSKSLDDASSKLDSGLDDAALDADLNAML